MEVSGYPATFYLLFYDYYTLKNAGLNTAQRWVKYGQTQRSKTTQSLFVHTLPSTGLYLTQHLLECMDSDIQFRFTSTVLDPAHASV